ASQGTIALTGADRASFLHALLTNDIAILTSGKGTYAAYLTPQGRMISDMRVIETGTRVLLGVEREVAAPLSERFDKLVFSEDVQAKDVTSDLNVIGVHGPSAARMIQSATGVSVIDLAAQYDSATSESLTIVRDDALGLAGYDVYVAANDAAALRAKLSTTGAVAASEETGETLRIEAGRPRFGMDMTTDTIPLEAGIEDRAISFTKGCYVGQEVIIRVMHRGHGRVARRLVSIVLSGETVPARGTKIHVAERVVGEITSATTSPKIGAPLALGYVQRDHAEPGTELTVEGSQARVYQPVD
ncbi:MAG TPA: glycine cleavage T C-terminal barrel domain-containing protein, partial [Burkholderiales bacterium]|nr:glycine cleavage T C-terminal barrel domain-containing protein [Burkholderiales bacterium]